MTRLVQAACAVLLALTVGHLRPAGTWAQPGVVPLARAHAHNDYLHTRPLLDVLDHGFTSVEADVWLVKGDLLVAHDLRETHPERSLRALYLEPLRRLIEQRGGAVFPGYAHPVLLLVDVKSDALPTYRVLGEQLKAYEGMLTVFTPAGTRPGPVLAVISGNRPREFMQAQTVRYAGYDGRLPDLGSPAPASFMPLVSDNWMLHFAWTGMGPMPEDERRKLREIVMRAHGRRQRVRFWATPDAAGPPREAVWLELLRAGVDYINTDRLDDLRQFLLGNDPTPSAPPQP